MTNTIRGPQAEWATDEAIQCVRVMWAAGDSTQAIGDALGVTKNCIINMRRTLDLPGRPNPVVRRARRAPMPSLVQGPIPRPAANLPPLAPLLFAALPEAPRRTIPAARPAPIPAPIRRYARSEPCCWVTEMSTGGRLPLYCDTESLPGLPYCPAHAQRSYLPGLKRRVRDNALIGGE